MSALLSVVMFLMPLWTGQDGNGTATGTIRDAAGNPKVGVPVVAIAASATRCDLRSNLTKTDAAGVYRLAVTPGEYFVATPSGNRTMFYPRAETRENAT